MPIFAEKFVFMAEKDIRKGRGGAREGAGRPKGDSKLFTFRVPGAIARHIDAQENKTEFIKSCIISSIAGTQPDFTSIGEVIPATKARTLSLPFYENISVVAGFPIPLDNDERTQDIDVLGMLCPYPESCYLIRVEGDSMIDDDIHSGDIIIVDKSNRNPSESQVAVCELNGEYTIKHFVREDGRGWLVPANPDYPRIEVTEDDDFSIWGVVTYVIHKPRG